MGFWPNKLGLLNADPFVLALGELLETSAAFHDVHEIVDAPLLDSEFVNKTFGLEDVIFVEITSLNKGLA